MFLASRTFFRTGRQEARLISSSAIAMKQSPVVGVSFSGGGSDNGGSKPYWRVRWSSNGVVKSKYFHPKHYICENEGDAEAACEAAKKAAEAFRLEQQACK